MYKEGDKVIYNGPPKGNYLSPGDRLTIVWQPAGYDFANVINARNQAIRVDLKDIGPIQVKRQNRPQQRVRPVRQSTRFGDDNMSGHEESQSRFYRHLCMHPNAHADAAALAKRICVKDPAAIAFLKTLAAGASTDPRKANALRAIAVCVKEECGDTPMVAGLSVGSIVKTALSPAAWALHSGAGLFHWVGHQFQKISHAI
jgi:hypothetical protein